MKWDGQALVDDIKYGLNLLLTDNDKKNALIMKHKEFTSYLKDQHILDMEPFSRCIGAGSIVLTCNSYGVDFNFQRELNNLGDRIISLTWSMAARFIRAWECEKANETSKEEKTSHHTMCDSCINKDEKCLIPSEDECVGYTSVNDKGLSIANEQKEDKPMAAPKAFNFNSFISENNQVKQIPLDMLVPYHNHKFKLYEGERLNDMVQSVKSNGVISLSCLYVRCIYFFEL